MSLSGAISAGIAHVTEIAPTILGKPSLVSMQAIADRAGVSIADVLVVGDDVDIEIRMGRETGALAALVLSGTAGARGEAELAALPEALRPHLDAIAGEVLARTVHPGARAPRPDIERQLDLDGASARVGLMRFDSDTTSTPNAADGNEQEEYGAPGEAAS